MKSLPNSEKQGLFAFSDFDERMEINSCESMENGNRNSADYFAKLQVQ